MTRHGSPFDLGALDEWLEEVAAASRTLIAHVVDHVDRLVEDVVSDANEVARRAVDLFDDVVASLHERDSR